MIGSNPFQDVAWLKNQREKKWGKAGSRFTSFFNGVILGLLENRSKVVYGGAAFSRKVDTT